MIVSCDLTDQVDTDCNGVHLGTAYIDDCGYCADGDTGRIPNVNKDCCGECFGDHINCNVPCEQCGDVDAVNYDLCDFDESCTIEACEDCENLFQPNSDLCINNICNEYIPENSINYTCDKSREKSVYEIGDQISCIDAVNTLDICFPISCENEFSLSDLYGKVTWIEMTTSW